MKLGGGRVKLFHTHWTNIHGTIHLMEKCNQSFFGSLWMLMCNWPKKWQYKCWPDKVNLEKVNRFANIKKFENIEIKAIKHTMLRVKGVQGEKLDTRIYIDSVGLKIDTYIHIHSPSIPGAWDLEHLKILSLACYFVLYTF